VRLIVSVAFLAGWVAVLAPAGDPSDDAALVAWAGLGLGAGLLLARWWVVVLALGYAVVAVAADTSAACLGDAADASTCSSDVPGRVLLVELPAMMLTIALGVAAGKLLRRLLRRPG